MRGSCRGRFTSVDALPVITRLASTAILTWSDRQRVGWQLDRRSFNRRLRALCRCPSAPNAHSITSRGGLRWLNIGEHVTPEANRFYISVTSDHDNGAVVTLS